MNPKCENCEKLKKRLKFSENFITACTEFLITELHWEYFREEMLYYDDKEKQTQSGENARKLLNFLAKIEERKRALAIQEQSTEESI